MLYHWWLNQNVTNGYAYATDIFTPDEIAEIIQIGQDSEKSTKEDPLVSSKNDKDYRNCNLSFIRSDIPETKWVFQRLTDVMSQINQSYFKFDLDYIQSLQFTEYFVGAKYGKHTDVANKSERPRKLSFVLQLSDVEDYKGGELKIYFSDEPYVAAKEKGTLTAFPSYSLHEVTDVTQGKRYSLVGWVCGPAFK